MNFTQNLKELSFGWLDGKLLKLYGSKTLLLFIWHPSCHEQHQKQHVVQRCLLLDKSYLKLKRNTANYVQSVYPFPCIINTSLNIMANSDISDSNDWLLGTLEAKA